MASFPFQRVATKNDAVLKRRKPRFNRSRQSTELKKCRLNLVFSKYAYFLIRIVCVGSVLNDAALTSQRIVFVLEGALVDQHEE